MLQIWEDLPGYGLGDTIHWEQIWFHSAPECTQAIQSTKETSLNHLSEKKLFEGYLNQEGGRPYWIQETAFQKHHHLSYRSRISCTYMAQLTTNLSGNNRKYYNQKKQRKEKKRKREGIQHFCITMML